MTIVAFSTVNIYFAKAQIIGGILPNLVAFGFFLGAISYFLFTGPLFGRERKDE